MLSTGEPGHFFALSRPSDAPDPSLYRSPPQEVIQHVDYTFPVAGQPGRTHTVYTRIKFRQRRAPQPRKEGERAEVLKPVAVPTAS